MEMKKAVEWTEESARERRFTRLIGGLFEPIFGLYSAYIWPIFGLMFIGLMAEIDNNFLLPFKNSALYFQPYFFRPTVIQPKTLP